MNVRTFFIALSLIVSINLQAKDAVWFNGTGAVSYTTQEALSPVVETALHMFADDMQALTGQKAVRKSNGSIQIYQLDKLNDKEFTKLSKGNYPINQIITKSDAYYIGNRNGRVVIIGSNARGTAYGLLELSHMAGVSAWTWWDDVKPERKRFLSLRNGYATIQVPRVEYRGIALSDADIRHRPYDYEDVFRLMLRLKANTIWPESQHDLSAALVEKYDLHVGSSPSRPLLQTAKKTKGHKAKKDGGIAINLQDDGFGYLLPPQELHKGQEGGLYYHLSQGDNTWYSTIQPGLVHTQLEAAVKLRCTKMWVAELHSPKTAAYALQLFMDMAWNPAAVTDVQSHLALWLQEQLGSTAARNTLPLMKQFYHLTGIRKPEYMDTELFAADEFGNELERYIKDYENLKRAVGQAEKSVSPNRKDAFFALIKYPVCTAAAVATKELQAQEARHIARPQSFHHDEEALSSAVRSWNAWQEILALAKQYDNMADGKWKGVLNTETNSTIFGPPNLPDKLSAKEIKEYSNSNEVVYSRLDTDKSVVKNATDYRIISQGAEQIPFLGHSTKAVKLPPYGFATYNFYGERGTGAVLRVALIPTHPLEGNELKVSVSVDGDSPTELSINLKKGSKEWKEAVKRGQAVASLRYYRIPRGSHKLTIRAQGEGVIIDQWMIDYDVDRLFYMFPVNSAK